MRTLRVCLVALLLGLIGPGAALAQDELGLEEEEQGGEGPFHDTTTDTDEVGPVDVQLREDEHGHPAHHAPVDVTAHGDEHDTTVHDTTGVHGDEHSAGAHGAHGPGAHGDEHGAHDEHHAEVNTFELGGSVVNFALLLLVLFLLMRKSLPEFLRNRRASVVEGMEEARRVKEEAETKYKEYSARIDNLDAELDRLREEMRRAGMDERDRIVADASKRAEKMRDEARFLIDQQMKQLREDLTREAIEAAVAAAETMLSQATSPQDQERLAKDYLGTIRTSLSARLAPNVQEKQQ